VQGLDRAVESLRQLLRDPSIASKNWVYQQYDHTVRTGTDVVKAIQGIVRKDAADPHVIKLARQITSGNVDWQPDPRTGSVKPVVKFHDRYYRAPEQVCRTRDDACEIESLWEFVVLNVRYVFDPPHVDTYRCVEFQCTAARCGFGIAEHHADLLANLVDKDKASIRFRW
jgi:hypothetical protein